MAQRYDNDMHTSSCPKIKCRTSNNRQILEKKGINALGWSAGIKTNLTTTVDNSQTLGSEKLDLSDHRKFSTID